MEKTLQFFKRAFFAVLAFVGMANYANAQCAAGEVEVFFDVTTDQWGYELYWELTPSGTPCGDAAAIFTGGTVAVGCTGGGAQTAVAGAGSYANSATVTEGGFCLTIGQDYDIIMVDDWGDGASNIVSLGQGVDVTPSGASETFTFTAQAPIAEDLQALKTVGAEYTRIPFTQASTIPLTICSPRPWPGV